MKIRLLIHALIKFSCGLVLFALMLFLPAGSMDYHRGWLLLALLFAPMFVAGLVMFVKNPRLLEKRLQAREKESEQRTVILLSLGMFCTGFITAGLDFRFGWSRLPNWCTVAASSLFLLGYALYAEVLRENTWLSRTIEVQENQTVVDTGLYGVVRHPMYAATLLLFLSMPLVLGSVPAFVIFLSYPFIIVKRIRNEEAVLAASLRGYAQYMQKVKYRLIPYIW